MSDWTEECQIDLGTDFVIVGQGIAGTLLAYFLQKSGKRILVFDSGHREASSALAAGIMNPVTGRNFVKTWMADAIFPFARETYRQIERELGIQILTECPILRSLPDPAKENDWFARCGAPELSDFVYPDYDYAPLHQVFHGQKSYAALKGGRCDLPVLIEAYRQKLDREGCLRETAFPVTLPHPARLPCPVIYCEGAWAVQNPYLAGQPFQPSKGEVLFVEIQDYPLPHLIVKHELFIVPLGSDTFWVGSGYNNHFADSSPSASFREQAIAELNEVLKVPYCILDHRAAIRPAARNRRPILWQHPEFAQIFVFNGLGAKGATLGPWFAHEMASLLISSTPVH